MSTEAASLESFSEAPRSEAVKIAAPDTGAEVRFGKWLYTHVAPVAAGLSVVFGLWSLASLLSKDLTGPAETIQKSCDFVLANFWGDANSIGLPFLVLYSLLRVLAGFALGAVIAVPLGFWIGTSDFAKRMLGPIVEICRPISPLAWYPVALALCSAPLLQNDAIKPQTMAATFVVFICSLWPTVLSTAFGAGQINKDYLNVARMLKMTPRDVFRKIYWPATLPHILAGLRISLGIGWMMIVAAEMLNRQDGIGFFCWEQFNAGSIDRSILAMACIGVVGMTLNAGMLKIEKSVQY